MPTIDTRLGRMRGVAHKGAVSFLRIPYAAPPVGALRWKAPEPPAPWQGVLDATRHPDRGFQAPFPPELAPHGGIPGGLSEDMLYLNVHTPAADGHRRPVMVYIHGGGYTLGSANDFDPYPFAARNDVVVVCINYRIGIYGFLDLRRFGPEYAGSASLGFQDQVLAIRWVSENIADFGGDPDNVTLCGCSAGGGSVIALLSAPSARGLFHRGIAMSPAEIMPSPQDVIGRCAATLGLDEAAVFERLQASTGEELFALHNGAAAGSTASVDGHAIPYAAVDAIAARVNNVPLLTGCAAAEGPMLTQGVIDNLGDDPALFRMLEAGMLAQVGAGDAARYAAFLDRVTDGATPAHRLDRVWLDFFRAHAVRTAQALADAGTPAWLYSFAVPTEHRYGPTHGADVPFAFNSLDPANDGELRVYYRNDARTRGIAALWSGTFVQFMRTGNPVGAGIDAWPTYTRAARACLVLGDTPSVVDDPDGPEALAAYGAG